MPFVYAENITEDCRLLVWELTETEEALRKILPAAADQTELATISHSQKKREWLAGRVLLTQIVAEAGEVFQGTWRDEYGKPFLIGSNHSISLTHTLDYVAAVIHPTLPVGIDMEKMDEKLRRTARKFLNDGEMAEAGEDLQKLCVYWCGKEALYKLNGRNQVSFKNHIRIAPFDKDMELLQGTLQDADQRVDANLHVRWWKKYCLVVAV